ncbi:MAG: DUF1566 domain-containing protein, partial [Flavobacteriales bacterium]|nr:DUF1566 domain-containing protein [Flavobacteriales bacterium]
MKPRLFILLLIAAASAQVSHAQDVLGCTAIYADNYNPDATINDGTCNYDLPLLLGDGYCIGELLNGGVLWQDLRGISYQGGVIVHVDENEGKALVCDETDYNGGQTYTWGCYGTTIAPADEQCALYQGEANTQAIVTNGCVDNPDAANTAYQATVDGFTDWFLPTPAEYYYAYTCPGWNSGLSSSYDYWTSSQRTSTSAYYWDPGDPSYCYFDQSKGSPNRIRLMRYVDISQNCLEQGICGDWQYNGEQLQPENAGVSCNYGLFNCSAIGDGVWNQIVAGIYPASATSLQYGLGWDRDLILNIPTTYPLDGNDYDIVDYTITGIDGIPTGISSGLQVNDAVGQNGQLCCSLSGTALEEGTFTLTV